MPDRDPTLREQTARRYLEKVDASARAVAERLGPPFNAEDVSWDRVCETWDTPSEQVDEATAWQMAFAKAAQMLEEDKTLQEADVLAEVPLLAAAVRYPERMNVLRSFGVTRPKETAEMAEKIEGMAAKRREKAGQGAEGEEAVPMAPGTEPGLVGRAVEGP